MHRQSTALDTWTVSENISSFHDLSYDQHCAVNTVPEIIISSGCDPSNQDINGRCIDGTSTIYTGDGETFDDLPPMPVALESHCVVALDGNNLFVTGGRMPVSPFGYSNMSYLYHSDTKEWEELPGLLTPRQNHACARVHNSNGEEEVVVAGGSYCEDDYCPGSLDLVDIYNLQSGQWREGHLLMIESIILKKYIDNNILLSGNPLPLTLEDTTVVPDGESFLLVGGYHEDNPTFATDTIYKYEILSDSWTLLDTRIPYNVSSPIALMVDFDIFPSC